MLNWVLLQIRSKATESGPVGGLAATATPPRPTSNATAAPTEQDNTQSAELQGKPQHAAAWLEVMVDGRWQRRHVVHYRCDFLEIRTEEDPGHSPGKVIPLQMVHSITFDTDTKHKARAAGAQGFIIDLHDGEAATFRCTTPAECGNWVRRLRSSASILSFADIDVVRAIDFPVGAFADVFQASATLPFQSVHRLSRSRP